MIDRSVLSYFKIRSRKAVVSPDSLESLKSVGKFAKYYPGYGDDPDLETAGSITYGKWNEVSNISAADMFIPQYMIFSDYDNSSAVEWSNYRVFLEKHRNEGVIPIRGGYNTNGVAIPLNKMTEEMVEELSGLSDYPVLDESDLSEMESEIQNEAWENVYRSDFENGLMGKFDLDELNDENLDSLFYDVSDRIGEYWQIESGGNAYIDVDNVVSAVTEEDMKNFGIILKNFPPILDEPDLRFGRIFQIKDVDGQVIYQADVNSLKECVEKAVREWSSLSLANFSEVNLSGANISRANLYRANLYRADLSLADLSLAYLSLADLSLADLSGANLSGANLSGVDLSGVDLWMANLSGANLTGATLWKANLEGADLSGANLEGANLEGANIKGANLKGTILEGKSIYEITGESPKGIPILDEPDLRFGQSDPSVEDLRKLGIVVDLYNYFIKGWTKKDDRGLVDLFNQTWTREPGMDYYPDVSRLALENEGALSSQDSWDADFVNDMADAFNNIVPQDNPNYGEGSSLGYSRDILLKKLANKVFKYIPLLDEPDLRFGQKTHSEKIVENIKARRHQLIQEHKSKYGTIQWPLINRTLSDEYSGYPQELKISRRRATTEDLFSYYEKILRQADSIKPYDEKSYYSPKMYRQKPMTEVFTPLIMKKEEEDEIRKKRVDEIYKRLIQLYAIYNFDKEKAHKELRRQYPSYYEEYVKEAIDMYSHIEDLIISEANKPPGVSITRYYSRLLKKDNILGH